MRLRLSPLSRLIMVTRAPATRAPAGSVTSPLMMPVGVWARASDEKALKNQNEKTKTNVTGFLAIIGSPLKAKAEVSSLGAQASRLHSGASTLRSLATLQRRIIVPLYFRTSRSLQAGRLRSQHSRREVHTPQQVRESRV